jgi:PadR family transcriptional regulator PadR
MGRPRVTAQTERVLLTMLQATSAEHYGLELAKATGLKSGTIYPTLARLEEAGWITGSWEQIDPTVEGRRPRRYYRLTASGVSAAEDVLDALRQLVSGREAPAPPPRLRPA